MTQEEFKGILDKNEYSYKQDGKWLIIDHVQQLRLQNKNINILPEYLYFNNNDYVTLSQNNLKELPDNIIFNNKGIVYLSFNNLKKLSKNIIITKNVYEILLNVDIKLKYYGNYFSKVNNIRTHILNDNLKFEKMILMYHKAAIYLIDTDCQTPHICLTIILEDISIKEFININLPKNFLSISSWI